MNKTPRGLTTWPAATRLHGHSLGILIMVHFYSECNECVASVSRSSNQGVYSTASVERKKALCHITSQSPNKLEQYIQHAVCLLLKQPSHFLSNES